MSMGRPKRKEIDKLRTKIWYESIRKGLNLKNPYEMDAYFDSGTNRNWYKYKDGMRVPTHATLANVERKCPGSRAVFDTGPQDVKLWQALARPHNELWEVIDISFPNLQTPRKYGLLGIPQYANEFGKQLLPQKYHATIDFIEHGKGVQNNKVYLAHSKGEISLTPEIAVSVIAFWRLCSLVMFEMLKADYLLSGVKLAFYHEEIFGADIDNHLWKYLNDHLREEYHVAQNQK